MSSRLLDCAVENYWPEVQWNEGKFSLVRAGYASDVRKLPREIEMQLFDYVGTVAAICTTGAFIPQIVKIRRRGGEDLSHSMLLIYLVGILLWLIYGVLLRAPEIIWANAATALLVVIAMVLKVMHPARKRAENAD